MAAEAKRASTRRVLAVVPLTFDGRNLPADADLRDVLPAHVLAAVLERGEARES